jgi:4-hydroxy-tetrahydrodipicolinate synthase
MDAVLVVTPYYNRPSQAGIEAHFRHVCASTPLPVVVYDIPVRTGRKIGSDLIVKMANEIPNVVALKDAAGDPAATAAVIAAAPEGFEVYSGDDPLTLPLLAVGAVGVIGVATHWCAPVMREMFDAWWSGDVAAARAANARMLESFAFETGDLNPNPVPTKAMLRALGQPAGPCRPPMGFGPDDLESRALAVHQRLYA